jgi:hypothetical protein
MNMHRDSTQSRRLARTRTEVGRIPTNLVIGLLVCDALWLLGDNFSGLAETEQELLRWAAWASAAILCCVEGIMLSAKAPLIEAATRTFTASMTAAVPVVAIGLIWFPRQFMRDTELFNFLIWIVIAATLVSCAFAALALVASALAKLVRRRVHSQS